MFRYTTNAVVIPLIKHSLSPDDVDDDRVGGGMVAVVDTPLKHICRRTAIKPLLYYYISMKLSLQVILEIAVHDSIGGTAHCVPTETYSWLDGRNHSDRHP